MNRAKQQRILANLIEQAKEAGLKIRWSDQDIVVIGLPPGEKESPASVEGSPSGEDRQSSAPVSTGED